MGSEARAIELTVVSATDLKKVKKFNHQRCYVVAYIYSAQRQATHIDHIGGINPTWNAPLILPCYETDLYPDGSNHNSNASSSSSSSSSSRSINIDIYSRTSGFFGSGDKLVGSVVVPLHLVASVAQVERLSAMAFDVHRPSGRIQGKMDLTLKLGEKQAIAVGQQQQASYAYHRYKVENSPPGMRPVVTSYSAASGALSTQGVYNPSISAQDKQEIVTGYPAAGYAFAPLGALSPAQRPQEVGLTPSTRVRGNRGRRSSSRAPLSRADRKARRKKRIVTGALIVGGVILGLILL